MSDDLIRSLQREWQAQEYDASEVLRRLRRARWTPHLVFALEVLGCCLALGVGVWFAWVAAHQPEHRILYSSVCLGVSLGSWIWMAWRTRIVRAERDACDRLLGALRI